MKRTSMRTLGWRAAAVLSASIGLAACADVPPPTAQLGASSQAIQTAEQAGALRHAPAEFQTAREKLAAADAAMRKDERTRARRLAEEAQVDAQLAAARSRSAQAQQAAGAVRSLATPPVSTAARAPGAAAGMAGGSATGAAAATWGTSYPQEGQP